MENVLVDNTPISYRCDRILDKDGLIRCRGILIFQPGQLMQRCPECSTWIDAGSDHLVQLEIQTGAATGARDKWTVNVARSFSSFRNVLSLECGVTGCAFRKQLEATRVHASAVNMLMDEHPCPQPPPEPVNLEPLPVAEETDPGAPEYQ